MEPNRRLQLFFVSLFLTGLFLPGIAMVSPMGASDTSEKRSLAPFPTPSSTSLREFPRKVDDYVRDHFGFRDVLIRWNNRFKVRVLRTSPVRNAIVGRDGWLFYAAYGDGADVRDHLGRLPLSPAQVEDRRRSIESRAAFFAERGIPYLFVVVPNKQTIYPGKTALRRGMRAITRLDQIVWEWPEGGSGPFLDLRATLLSARSKRDLYYRTDSHWNLHGAFLGFQAILRRLSEMRPDVPLVGEDYVHLSEQPRPGGDVADLLAMSDELGDIDQGIEWQDESKSPLRVVLIGDSSAESLHPFFEARFAYMSSMAEAIGGHFDVEAVLAQHPDLVIEAHIERYLTSW